MVMYTPQATLLRLSDTELRPADPFEDIRGRKVLDVAGEELGDVDDLLIDAREHKVRFLQIASGGFLGLGATKFLVPVEAITSLTVDTVHVHQGRKQVAGAPRYEPSLVDERYVTDIYSHYGYPPYWGLDYYEPPYPTEAPGPAPGSTRQPAQGASVRPREMGSTPTQMGDRELQLREVMTSHVEVIPPEATLWEAAQKMAALDVGPLPVCTGEQLVGMLTDRDITVRATAKGLDPKTTRVHEVMTPDVLYAYEDQNVGEATRLMAEHQIRRLVVLNRAKQLVGLVSLGDLAVSSDDARQTAQTLERISEPAEPQR